MAEEHNRELQLLPTTSSSRVSGRASSSSGNNQTAMPDPYESLNLQLSISLQPVQLPSDCVIIDSLETHRGYEDVKTYVEALKRHAVEQIRLAAAEKAHAERVRELTRREMELAESEFARARHMWDRARDEVDKAERMKDKAARRVDLTCMEITCQSCRKRFRS